MRIVCEQCSAAYAIEDRLITPKGVRGQCPRCRHVQLVRLVPKVEVDDALLASPLRSAEAAVACSDCGKPLTDAFDLALGTCDDCRAVEAAPEETPAPDDAGANRSDHLIRRAAPASERSLALPVSPGAVRNASRGPEIPEERRRPRAAAAATLAAAVVVALGAVGGAVWLVKRNPGSTAAANVEAEVAAGGVPAEIKAVLPRWQMAFVSLSGDSGAALKRGRAKLEEDRPSSYDAAREEFQKALLLDPSSDEAIVGYVRALAAGNVARAAGPAWDEARSLIRAAERRQGRTPEEALVHAELLVLRSTDAVLLEEARRLAEWVADTSGEVALKARAQVVIGRTWQASSTALAVRHFDDALSLIPGHGRALSFRALAHEGMGEYGLALADLRKRLDSDPLHPEVNAQLARLYLDAGRSDLARKVYERILAQRPRDLRARLPLATFEYQVEGKFAAAVMHLRELEKELENFEVADQVQILTHLAAAERAAGRGGLASNAAKRALGLVGDAPEAHLELLHLALERGQATEAATHLESIRGKLADTAFESMLEGRLRLLEGRWEDAVSAFQKAATAESWRVHALLLSGVAAAGGGRRDDAFRYLFEAARSDPTWEDVRHRELLRGMEGRILTLATGDMDLSPRLYEGVLRFYQGDLARAERLFQEALDMDARNALAFAWRALTALQRGDLTRAESAAKNAAAHGRQVGLAQYAAGAVSFVSNRPEEAGRLLREAVRLEPGFLGAELRLAELDARSGNAEAARERLRGILARAPGYLPARRLLFSLAGEDGP
ncbi:MAG: tetratricopeptide repeat protein [Myxococcaceae bacterium]